MRTWRSGLAGAGLGIVWIAGAAVAQHRHAPVGVQIGYSRSELGGANGGRLASRQGALAGVYLTGRLSRRVALQPELLFAIKGGRTTARLEGGGTAPAQIELAYLEIPVLLKLTELAGRRRMHPVFFGGIAPSVRVGCDLVLTLDTELRQIACEDADSASVERLDVGGVIGAGVQLDWLETALALEARYTIGLTSILGRSADVRNRQLGIMLALSF